MKKFSPPCMKVPLSASPRPRVSFNDKYSTGHDIIPHSGTTDKAHQYGGAE